VTTTHAPDPAEVRRAVEAVPDPELPPVTIGMLGMVHAVTLDGDRVEVELLPTFSGCPATEMIERDVVAAVTEVAGVGEVRVRFRFDPPWTSERIDERGRARLREFGIAPPGGQVAGARPDGRPTLPLAPALHPRPCPYCGSEDTTQESSFGPTPCRDIRFCASCQQPFEGFKSL
jgi:ring-1,2-phenylacetyl-CoA epoxidase subunit PaaD